MLLGARFAVLTLLHSKLLEILSLMIYQLEIEPNNKVLVTNILALSYAQCCFNKQDTNML